jgi:hypothetical protein
LAEYYKFTNIGLQVCIKALFSAKLFSAKPPAPLTITCYEMHDGRGQGLEGSAQYKESY